MKNKSHAKAGSIIARFPSPDEYTFRAPRRTRKETRADRRSAAREIRNQLSEGADA